MSEKLKPCWHCGGEVHVLTMGERFRVYCKNIHCAIGPSRETKAEAVAAWNTRVEQQPCEWREIGNSLQGMCKTGCGKIYTKQHYEFCPFCGRRIKESKDG